jgi:hypothetical protein
MQQCVVAYCLRQKIPMYLGEFMQTSVSPCTAGLAFAGAGILTLSLLTATAGADAAVPHGEVHAVQLAAVTASAISIDVVGTADALTRVVPHSSLTYAAAATSPSATPVVHPAATTADATAANPGTIVMGIAGIAADVAVGVAGFAVFAPIWYLLVPITFPLTYLATAVSGCVYNCFSNAAISFWTAPFAIPEFAFQQASALAAALIQSLTVPAAAAVATTSTTATVADSPPRVGATTQADATPGVARDALPAEAVDAVDASLPPRGAAVADTNTVTATTPAAKAVDARLATPSAAVADTNTVAATTPAAKAVDARRAPQPAAAADGDTVATAAPPTNAVSAGKTGKKAATRRTPHSTGSNETN